MIGKRRAYDICWINVVTTELDSAKGYFERLFGWTYGDGIPGGNIILVGNLPAGAIMDQAMCPPGVPAVIGIMIKVENADATVARVNELGGHAEPAFDVMDNGRMAECTDPNGCFFAIWQPLSKDSAECDTQAHGAPTWFETLTVDLDASVEFYTRLFGWKASVQNPDPCAKYVVFENDGIAIAGAMKLPADKVGKVPPHWGTYFAVTDADAAAARSAELGGPLCLGPLDIPNVGRFALLKSPQGVSFHVIRSGG